ncbi:MAG: PD-(D/E)XK nuclease family protein [Erysipelotrichaceae bacterium]|nr:PD-(D/E)XK nuclease family protein [Erysipelotrichaceae bacterium]
MLILCIIWISIMNKPVIVLSSIYKTGDILKSSAYFNDVNFNIRYYSPLELARYLLQLSGIVIKERFISNDDLGALIYHEVKKIPYFANLSFNDVLGLINSINDLRRYIVGDEEDEIISHLPKDKFVKKNEATISFYILMKEILDNNNLIDEVGIIRYAYEHISTFPNIEFRIYEGDKLINYHLIKALLDKAAGHKVIPTRLEYSSIKIASYTKAFSQVNEIEDIINYIYQNNIPFDEVLIASSETNDYGMILSNYHDLLGFPFTIGVGKNIINTNPGRLFSIIIDYLNNNYHPDYLKKIINDECFDTTKFKTDLEISDNFDDMNKDLEYRHRLSFDSILSSIGDLKLSFFDSESNNKKVSEYEEVLERHLRNGIDKDDSLLRNSELTYLYKYRDIINRGLYSFIERYSLITDSSDENGLAKILKELSYFDTYKIPFKDIVNSIFLQSIGKKNIEPGKLYFTSINNASSVLRKYLFIVGLSSNNYPGKRKEDPYLLDRDYEAFNVLDASSREIENNKNNFYNLLFLASKHKCDIHLSYSYYNSASLKNQNASSILFETYKLENGASLTVKDFDDEFVINKSKYRTIEYFSNDVLPISHIGRVLASNQRIEYGLDKEEVNKEIHLPDEIKNKALSASDIVNYNDCPYLFYLSKVMKIEQEEDIDIFQLIPPNEYGNIAHSLLENLDKKNTSLEEFLVTCKSRYDDYFKMHVTDNIPLKDNEEKAFLEMMTNAYHMEESERSIKEKEIYASYEDTGIMLHGYPDKVVLNKNKEAYIVDYKTGRNIKHDIYDPSTLLQCTVYAYLLTKKKKMNISGFEYRYIRYRDGRVSSMSNPDILNSCYSYLDNVMHDIKTSFDSGEFPTKEKHCKDCYYKSVCLRKK